MDEERWRGDGWMKIGGVKSGVVEMGGERRSGDEWREEE